MMYKDRTIIITACLGILGDLGKKRHVVFIESHKISIIKTIFGRQESAASLYIGQTNPKTSFPSRCMKTTGRLSF
jgi:hypothetical protein